jgi:voltage-gated potassium channel
MTARPNSELKSIGYELFMLALSALSIANVGIALYARSGPVQQVAILIETLIAPVFLFDFGYRLTTAPSRRGYLVRQFGWADLLSVAPLLGGFRVFRMARVMRLLRREGRDRWLRDLVASRAESTFLLTMFLVVFVVELAGMFVFLAEEHAVGANIRSSGDAIWWGLVTIATVGYGDRFPVTAEGRVVGVLLLFAGVALFSVLTGFIANAFLSPSRRRVRRRAEAGSPEALLDELRELIHDQEQAAAATRARLDELERELIRRERLQAAASPPG